MEDRDTAIDDMYKKFHKLEHVVFGICEWTARQVDMKIALLCMLHGDEVKDKKYIKDHRLVQHDVT